MNVGSWIRVSTEDQAKEGKLMNITLLQTHIANYKKHLREDREKHAQALEERRQRTKYYQSWTKHRLSGAKWPS
jgi:hypothetical protein